MLAFHSPWLLALCMALAFLAAASFVLAAQLPLRGQHAIATGTALWALPLALYDGHGVADAATALAAWLAAVAAAVLALALAGRAQLTARLGAVALLLAGSLAGPLLQGPLGTAGLPPSRVVGPMLLAAAATLLPALAAALLWPAGPQARVHRPVTIGLLTAALLAVHAALPWPAPVPVTGATGWTFPGSVGLEAALLAGLLLALGVGVWAHDTVWAPGQAGPTGPARPADAAARSRRLAPTPRRTAGISRQTRARLQQLARELQHCDCEAQIWAGAAAAGADLFRGWHGALAVATLPRGEAVVAGWGCLGVVRAAARQPLLPDRRRLGAAAPLPAQAWPGCLAPGRCAEPCGDTGDCDRAAGMAPARNGSHGPGRPAVIRTQMAWAPQRAGVLHLVAHRTVGRAEMRRTFLAAEALGETLQQALCSRQARGDAAAGGEAPAAAFGQALALGCARADRTSTPMVLALVELKPAPARAGTAAPEAQLQDLAERLRARLRPDDRVWRVGPARLALLAAQAPPETLRRRLDALCAELADQGGRRAAPLAVGLARDSRDTARDLLHRAEVALLAARRMGHGRVVCWDAWSDPRSYVVGLDRAGR